MGTSTLSTQRPSVPVLVPDYPKGSLAEHSDITLLHNIAKRFAAATPADVVQHAMDFVLREVQCDSCVIYLLEGEEFLLRASRNPLPGAVDHFPKREAQMITISPPDQAVPIVLSRNASKDPRFKILNGNSEDRFESFLSLPVVLDGRLLGFINLQSRAVHPYAAREVALTAAVGLVMATELDRKKLKSENAMLTGKLETRRLVERAKGILQRDLSITEEASYRVLQRESQERRRSMKDIAEAVILSDSLKASPCVNQPPGCEKRGAESSR